MAPWARIDMRLFNRSVWTRLQHHPSLLNIHPRSKPPDELISLLQSRKAQRKQTFLSCWLSASSLEPSHNSSSLLGSRAERFLLTCEDKSTTSCRALTWFGLFDRCCKSFADGLMAKNRSSVTRDSDQSSFLLYEPHLVSNPAEASKGVVVPVVPVVLIGARAVNTPPLLAPLSD